MERERFMVNRSPELEVLLLACRAQWEAIDDGALHTAAAAADWQQVLDFARRHKLLPLLLELTLSLGERTPPAIRDQLREAGYAHAVRTARLVRELIQVHGLFRQQGIPVLAFKGPTLARLAFGDAARRQFDDLDLLVAPADLARGRDAMLSAGYRPYPAPGSGRSAVRTHPGHGCSFVSEDGSYWVELDSRVGAEHFSFAIDRDELWAETQNVTIEGTPVRTLSTENTLLLLCVHGTKHAWSRLSWVADVASLMHRCPGIRWAELMARAECYGGRRMLGLGVRLARELLGVALPDPIAQAVTADPAARSLADEVIRRYAGTGRTELTPAAAARFHLRARERLGDRIRYVVLLAAMPTNQDWRMLPLPPRLSWLYYLLRPFLLAWRVSRRLFRRTQNPRITPARRATGRPGASA